MANEHRDVRPDRDDPQRNACWSHEQCIEACAGLLTEGDAFRLMEHSAGCASCSALLRQAKDLFANETTTGEETLLATLPSSSSSGFARTAKRLAGLQKRPRASRTSLWSFGRWMLPAASFATVCAVALLWLGFTHYRAASDDRLLAEAYDAARPYELRIQGSSVGDVASPTRASNSNFATSTALLKLKLKIQEQFERDPNKPAIRQMLGRIALVQHNPAEALRNFEMAQVLDPRLPRLAFDLGGAHFALAEITANQSEYDRAIDLFSQYLSVNPGDPVALFDRGLAWEHKGAYGRAIVDYESARKDEKDRAWRQVLEGRLSHLRALNTYLEESLPSHHHDWIDLAVLTQPRPEDYERYVEAALRDWLPQRAAGGPAVRQALVRIASLGKERHDPWLSDMLANPATASEIAAENELAASFHAYENGDSDGTMSHSQAASVLFRKSRNLPGQLRANLQHVYGLQSTGKAQACLQEADRLGVKSQLARYPAMQVATWLELAACHGMSGDDASAATESQTAVARAQAFMLPGLGLRAAGFVMVYQYAAGRLESSLRTGTAALQATANIRDQGVRRFQILHDMEDVARHNRLRFTVLGLAQEGARAAETSGNSRVLAYALEDLALAQLDAGDFDAAGHSFAEADQAISSLGAAPAANLYRADWQTDRASLSAKQHGVKEALASMAAAEPQFEHLRMVTPRTRFYTEYAALLRTNGGFAASLDKAWQATAGTEASLSNLQTTAARTGWLGSYARTYQVLIADLNDLNRPAEALAVWRWFRNAPYQAPRKSLTPATLGTQARLMPDDSTLHLVYARLDDHYTGWIVSAGSAKRAQRLSQDPQSLQETARIFASLCADPRSSRQDLDALGQRLTFALLGPFRDELAHAPSVELDLDESLIGLPFAALPVDGGFFGLTHALSYAHPAVSPVGHLPAGRQVALRSASLLLLRGAIDPDDPLPAVYDETAGLSNQFPHAAVEEVRLIRSGKGIAFAGRDILPSLLRRAEVLHYSGHGLGQADSTSASVSPVFQLSPNSLPRCLLAVIAACRTLGEREDDVDRVSSVARTFLDAGAVQVLATQWDVDSRTTQQMMLGLYKQLDQGTPADIALQHAMATISRVQQTAHPYYWSAYQIIHRSQDPLPRS